MQKYSMEFPFFSLVYPLTDPMKCSSQKALLYKQLSPPGKVASSLACDVFSNINMTIVSWVLFSQLIIIDNDYDNSIFYPTGKLCQQMH